MKMKEYRISDLFEVVEVQKIQGKIDDFTRKMKPTPFHCLHLLETTKDFRDMQQKRIVQQFSKTLLLLHQVVMQVQRSIKLSHLPSCMAHMLLD